MKQAHGIIVDLVDVLQSRWIQRSFFNDLVVGDLRSLTVTVNTDTVHILTRFTPPTLNYVHLRIKPPHPNAETDLFETTIGNVIGGLANVKTITIQFLRLDDSELEAFDEHGLPTGMQAQQSQWFSHVLDLLPHPQHLERFELRGCLANQSLGESLGRFEHLNALCFTSNEDEAIDINKPVVAHILEHAGREQLQALDLGVPNATEEFQMDMVTSFRHLRRLRIALQAVEPVDTAPLINLDQLQTLQLLLPQLDTDFRPADLKYLVPAWRNIQVLRLMTTVNEEDGVSEPPESDDEEEGDDDLADGPALELRDLEVLCIDNCPLLVELRVDVATPYHQTIPAPRVKFLDELALDLGWTTLERSSARFVKPYMKKLWPRLKSFTLENKHSREWLEIIRMYGD